MGKGSIIICAWALIALAGTCFGSVPSLISYQGKLTDLAGQPVAGSYNMTFKLFPTDTGGSPLWTESKTVQVDAGHLQTALGSTNPIPGSILDGNLYLEIVVEGTTLAPREQILAAAFALRAGTVDDGAITSAKLASGAVKSPSISDGTILDVDISPSAGIAPSKIAGTAWTGTNDGSGSGLDADLLDGQDSTAFASSSHNHDATYVNEGQANSITSGMITDGAVGLADISSAGASDGRAIMYSGASILWGNPTAGDLILPFARTVSSASDAFSVTNTGLGKTGSFVVNNADNMVAALYAGTNGWGPAVMGVTGGEGSAVHGYTSGSGAAVSAWATGNGTGMSAYADGDGRAIEGVANGHGAAAWFEARYAYSTSPAVVGDTYGQGDAAWFHIHNSSSSSNAITAYTEGTGNAVYASAPGPGAALKGETPSTASYANAVVGRVTSTSPGGWSSGVRGINEGTGGSGIGVYGSQNGGGWGVYGTTVYGDGVRGHATGNGNGVYGSIAGYGWAGYFSGGSLGNGVSISTAAGKIGLTVSGGTKNAVVATSTGARLLYTEESTEVWFTDYGFGKLENGRARVTIDPLFAETVDLTAPYHVFVQLNDLESAGVGVVNKTSTSFEVGELHKGRSNAEFSYRIVARRKNYEHDRLERAPEADNDPNLHPDRRAAEGVPIGG